jgi:hypothetical protein
MPFDKELQAMLRIRHSGNIYFEPNFAPRLRRASWGQEPLLIARLALIISGYAALGPSAAHYAHSALATPLPRSPFRVPRIAFHVRAAPRISSGRRCDEFGIDEDAIKEAHIGL